MQKISIIMPTYKRIHSLGLAIESVLNQTYSNLELLIIDDNHENSDYRKNTELLVDKYLGDSRVKYIKNKTNLGGALSRNVGISQATGEFIAFLDDDDCYLSTKLEKQYYFYKEKFKTSKKGFIYCQATYRDEKGQEIFNMERTPEKNELALFELLKTGFTSTGCLFLPKELLIEVEGFKRMKCGQEWFLILKILLKGYDCYCLKEKLLVYNDHLGERITNGKNKLAGEKELYELKKEHIEKMIVEKKKELHYYNNIRLAKLCFKFKKNKIALEYIIEAKKNKKINLRDLISLSLNYFFSEKTIKKLKVYF